jgi:hypothetical protein
MAYTSENYILDIMLQISLIIISDKLSNSYKDY